MQDGTLVMGECGEGEMELCVDDEVGVGRNGRFGFDVGGLSVRTLHVCTSQLWDMT
jgi:hypothetical protein